MPTRHPVRSLLTGIAVVAVALALAGCGSTTVTFETSATPAPTTAPTPTLEPSAAPTESAAATASQPSTGHIQLPDKGFGLTLPDGWQSLPVDPAALQAVVESLPEGSDMRNLLEGQIGSSALQSIAFWAFDFGPGNTTGSTPNMNIIVQPASTFDLALVDSSVRAELGAVSGIGSIESKIVTLPAGEAIRFDYTLDVGSPGTSQATVKTTQYYVPLPAATLIVSFSADQAGAAASADDFEAIIQSLEAAS